MRRAGLVVACATAALAGGGCHPVETHGRQAAGWSSHGPMHVVDRLNCPDHEGDLTLLNAAPGGASCQYGGPDDESVDLSLVRLNGADPAAALAPLEASLRSQIGPGAGGQANVKIQATSGVQGDRANIDLPGFHIHADGDKAQINLPGVSINADGDNAHVRTGWGGYHGATVDAHPGGAVIRAGDSGPQGSDLVLVLASDAPGPTGDKAAGYIARGPASGPLVVATFKSRSSNNNDHFGRSDLSRLVDLNVRG